MDKNIGKECHVHENSQEIIYHWFLTIWKKFVDIKIFIFVNNETFSSMNYRNIMDRWFMEKNRGIRCLWLEQVKEAKRNYQGCSK